MTQIFFDRGINDFKWGECLGSNGLYFKIGYWDKFFLDEELENVFEEQKDYDPDCGPLFSCRIVWHTATVLVEPYKKGGYSYYQDFPHYGLDKKECPRCEEGAYVSTC